MVDVCLLGCGGMMPLPDRRLTAMLYRFKGKMILIDCGEGTQVSIKLAGWGFKPVEAILFTHYHADHIAGLPGLLLTLANSGKTEPLTLLGPPGLKQVVCGLTVITPALPFDLLLAELPGSSRAVYRMGDIIIKSVPGDHRMPCLAYSLETKRAGIFDEGRANALGIPMPFWNRLQKGETIQHEGKQFMPQMVLGEPRKGIKVTYCTDSRPTDGLIELSRYSDLLICEGIYGEDQKKAGAIEKKHMIFSEAAQIAKISQSKELWLTHYSPSLKDPEEFIDNARAVFLNTLPGRDLMMKAINYE